MKRCDVGPETAQSKLKEACFSGNVRSRHLFSYVDDSGKDLLRFCSLSTDAWTSATKVDIDSGALHNLDLGTVELVEISEIDLDTWLARPPRRGPAPGKIARYTDADRALFNYIRLLAREKSLSIEEAARDLARNGRIAGRGTPESRARIDHVLHPFRERDETGASTIHPAHLMVHSRVAP
jgi:hypothetical protein